MNAKKLAVFFVLQAVNKGLPDSRLSSPASLTSNCIVEFALTPASRGVFRGALGHAPPFGRQDRIISIE